MGGSDARFGSNLRVAAAFGKIPLGNRQAIKYNAAWLFGTSHAAPDNTFGMQVEYEF